MTPPIVTIAWLDAHATATDTRTVDDLDHAPCEMRTVGYLLRSDEVGASIACEDSGGGTFRGISFIPRSLIVEITPVRRRRKPRRDPAAVDQP